MKWKHPGVLFMICLTIGAVAGAALPLPLPVDITVHVAFGAVLLGVAIGVWLSGAYEMRKAQTPIEPDSPPAALVTGGPFRVTRNPLYVSLVTTLLAIGILVASAWIVAAAGVLAVLLDRLVIPHEEARLTADFPEAFSEYRRRVRRWI